MSEKYYTENSNNTLFAGKVRMQLIMCSASFKACDGFIFD